MKLACYERKVSEMRARETTEGVLLGRGVAVNPADFVALMDACVPGLTINGNPLLLGVKLYKDWMVPVGMVVPVDAAFADVHEKRTP